MSLKKFLTINIFIIFALNFVSHFVYDLIPVDFLAIFFPVNESIYEHQKMIFTSFLLAGFIDYFLMKKLKVEHNNFITNILVTSIVCIATFLIIWLPVYYRIGENFILTIIILFVAICISQIVAFYILSKDNNKLLNYISLAIIIIMVIVFAYFTFNPLYNEFFFDPMAEKYGINTYKIK